MNNETLRIPPFSIEAEQSVLGGLLSDPEAMDRIPYLEAAHFYRWDHQQIFGEIQRQHMATRAPDPITVAERLGEKIENCLQYLIKMRNTEPSGARIRTHADIVVEKAKRRAIISMSDEMAGAAFGIQEPQEIADFFVGRMEALIRNKTMHEPQRMSSLMAEYVTLLEKRQTGEVRATPTGFEDLDHILGGGMEDGTVIVLAGRPGAGKSAKAFGIGGNVAADGGVVLLLSMEMTKTQVVDRRVSAIAGIPLQWLRRPDLDESQWSSLTRAIQMVNDQDFYIDDQTALNMNAIRAKARKIKRAHGRLNLLIVDQLSFITGSKMEIRRDQVNEYSRAFVALAKELGCPILLLCQLSRKCEERPNKRPVPSDLAESGNLEQDADTIIFMYRDEIYNENSADKGTAEAIVAKNRQGKTGTARLSYLGHLTKFANLAKGWHPIPDKIVPRQDTRGFD